MKQAKTKTIAIITIGIFVGILIGMNICYHFHDNNKNPSLLNDVQMANYNTLPYKIKVIEAYDKYYNNVENLLDELNNEYNIEDSHTNDTYYNYLGSKFSLDSLMWYSYIEDTEEHLNPYLVR